MHTLLGLQAAKVLLEEQVLLEQKGRLAAEASKDALSQQLAEQQSALAAAKQQVCVPTALIGQTTQLMCTDSLINASVQSCIFSSGQQQHVGELLLPSLL